MEPTKPTKTLHPFISEKMSTIASQLDTSTRETNLFNLLTKMCPKSGDCAILGKYTNLLQRYFNNFNSYLNYIKPIGKAANGFVTLFEYEKNNYNAYCVLKSSYHEDSDNLYLEWYVGKFFVNIFVPKFPCFVETYNLCQYKDSRNFYNTLKNLRVRNKMTTDINEVLEKMDDKTAISEYIQSRSCTTPLKFAVLIQHMSDPIAFGDFIGRNRETEYGFNIDIFQIFLQIFIPLGKLYRNFTHNDLHARNVLLYTIPNNKYIELKYTFENGPPIIIKTRYIAKIIDYGRSYYNWNGDSTNKFFKKLKLNPSCKKSKYDLNDVGYLWFEKPRPDNYYISQTVGNISKDLWLPNSYWNSVPGKYNNPNLKLNVDITNIFERVVLGEGILYQIPPKEECDNEKHPICNVKVFSENLCRTYLDPENNAYINQQYNAVLTGGSIGQLEIFVDDLTKDSKFTSEIISDLGGLRKRKRKTNKRKMHKRKTNKRKTNKRK